MTGKKIETQKKGGELGKKRENIMGRKNETRHGNEKYESRDGAGKLDFVRRCLCSCCKGDQWGRKESKTKPKNKVKKRKPRKLIHRSRNSSLVSSLSPFVPKSASQILVCFP